MDKYSKTQSDGTSLNLPVDGKGSTVEIITASRTLTAKDSGKTFLVATDELVVSIPATVAGLEYTFINTGANGNNIITISPVAADGIAGTITLASSIVTRAGTADTDLVNTKASATVGNSVKIVGTGVTGVTAYIIVSSTGIWA